MSNKKPSCILTNLIIRCMISKIVNMKKQKTLQDLPTDLFEKVSKEYRGSSFDHVELQRFGHENTRKIQQLRTLNGTEIFAVIEHRDKNAYFYITSTKPKDHEYADYKIFSVDGGLLGIPILSMQYGESIGGLQNLFYDYGDTAKYKILRFCTEVQLIVVEMMENGPYEKCKIPATKGEMRTLPPLFSDKEYTEYYATLI